jgi:hypothetical protein
MPRGLRIVRATVTLLAVGFAVALTVGVLDLAPRYVGYSVGGRAVTRAVWLSAAAPLFAVSAVWFGMAASALWLGRVWSRVCILGAFGSVGVFALAMLWNHSIPRALALRGLAQALILGAVSWYYLYRSRAPARYFAALRDRR